MRRCVGILLFVLLWPDVARADDGLRVGVLLDSCRRTEVARALRVELAGQKARVLAGGAPVGETGLARAAAAQASGRTLDVRVVVWLEAAEDADELHVIASHGDVWKHAPLPGTLEVLDARVVATIAASLVDETLAGLAEAAPRDSLVVEATVEAAFERPAPVRPPSLSARGRQANPPAAVVRRSSPAAAPEDDRAQLAIGAVALGGSLGLGARLHHRAEGPKLGVAASVGRVFGDDSWSFATLTFDVAVRPPEFPYLELGFYAGVHQGRPPADGDDEPMILGPAGLRTTWRLPLSSGAALMADLGIGYVGRLLEHPWAVTAAVYFELPR